MRNRLAGAAALLLLLPPVLVMALSLYGQSGLLFWDARTIPCGLQALQLAGDPNAYLRPDHAGPCAGYGYEYMLPPAITAVLANTTGGLAFLSGVYAALYGLALVALLRAARTWAGHWLPPLAAFLLAACGVYVFEAGGGNLTIIFLGLLTALLTGLREAPARLALTIPLCLVAAAFKPLFALYLLIPFFVLAELRLPVLAAAAAISVGYALDALLQPAEFDRWLKLIVPVVYGEAHFGSMRLLQALGLGAGDWLAQGLAYALWCGLVLAGLWRAGRHLTAPADRAMAALLAVTLLLPRLKEYDAIVLVPLHFWLASRLPPPRRRRLQWLLAVTVFLVPALWWWLRKLGLFIAVDAPTLAQVADPRWLIATQGWFLAFAALAMFAFLVWPPREAQ